MQPPLDEGARVRIIYEDPYVQETILYTKSLDLLYLNSIGALTKTAQ